MNLPNKLTVFRMILILPFVLLLLGGFHEWGWFTAVFGGVMEYTDYIALAVFIIASLTDLIDGKIARKYNLVTNFGKFMDPLADKLLVCAAMICLVEMGRIPAWVVIIIISREFIISGFRLVASDKGVVIAANYWGKFKTTFQMIMVCLMIANISAISLLTDIIMWIALALTVISLIDYVWANRGVMSEEEPEQTEEKAGKAEEAPEETVARLLKEKKMTLVTAESCTGGMLAAKLVGVPGVSAVFKEGFVTYANEAKEELLGVQDSTLAKYGAVSAQTAEEMVRGAAERAGADAAVSITGIAGPDGGTKEKPVGLVYIGCKVGETVKVEEYHFSGSRDEIRRNVTSAALVQLRDAL